MSAERQQSHVGAYALIRSDGDVLLVLKSRGPYTGQWDLPGGKIEWGETPENAACREVREETGLTVTDLRLLGVFSHTVRWKVENVEEQLHHLGILYNAQVEPGTVRQTGDAEDAAQASWHKIIGQNSEDLTPFARRALLSAT